MVQKVVQKSCSHSRRIRFPNQPTRHWPRVHVRRVFRHQGEIATLVESLLLHGSIEWLVCVGKVNER